MEEHNDRMTIWNIEMGMLLYSYFGFILFLCILYVMLAKISPEIRGRKKIRVLINSIVIICVVHFMLSLITDSLALLLYFFLKHRGDCKCDDSFSLSSPCHDTSRITISEKELQLALPDKSGASMAELT